MPGRGGKKAKTSKILNPENFSDGENTSDNHSADSMVARVNRRHASKIQNKDMDRKRKITRSYTDKPESF